MVKPASGSIDLPFARKYDDAHAQHYHKKHQQSAARRLSHNIEVRMARKALAAAGNPASVLDLPCGAGRFWPLLLENKSRTLIAADNSPSMIEVARRSQAGTPGAEKIHTLVTSAFAIELPDNAVKSVFCMRLLHHIGKVEDRLKMLTELQRVASETVIISLWVDGNIKSWRRKKLEQKRQRKDRHKEQNRFVFRQDDIENEFRSAGFSIRQSLDMIPGLSMWRTYVLECPR